MSFTRLVRAGIWSLSLLSFGACSSTTTNDIRAPAADKLVVYYQSTDYLVHGRGLPGAMPGVPFVFIAAHPSPSHTTVPVQPDGSFIFAIGANFTDLIEFAGTKDKDGLHAIRGSSSYVRVPVSPVPTGDWYCCKTQGKTLGQCQPVDTTVTNEACDSGGGSEILNTCMEDANCAFRSGQVIDFPPDAVDITPPDATGHITVSGVPGKLPPLTLIALENRGSRSRGGRDPAFRVITLSDEMGGFGFGEIAASGDDELVLQIADLEGYRSRENAIYVPDSIALGVDLVGAYAFAHAANDDKPHPVAIRFSPYGQDARGICPDSNEEPALCFSGGGTGKGFNGGLDFDSIHFRQFDLDGQSVLATLATTTTIAADGNNKFTDGDVLAGPQLMMLILDASAAGTASDPNDDRFNAAIAFVNALRTRDQMGLIAYGGKNPASLIVPPTISHNTLINAINTLLSAKAANTGTTFDMFNAVQIAATAIKQSAFTRGRLLIVTTANPSDDASYRKASDAVLANADGTFAGYPTYILGLKLPPPPVISIMSSPALDLRDLAGFSGGRVVDTSDGRGLLNGVSDVIGELSGAYVMLFDVPIARRIGKSASVQIQADVCVAGEDGRQLHQLRRSQDRHHHPRRATAHAAIRGRDRDP